MITDQLRNFTDEDLRLASMLLDQLDDDVDAAAHLLMVTHELRVLLAIAGNIKEGSNPGE